MDSAAFRSDSGTAGLGMSSVPADLIGQFNDKVDEVWKLLNVRVSDSVQNLFVKELEGLDAALSALEREVDVCSDQIQREMRAADKVVRLMSASSTQRKHLDEIQGNLPARLPSRPSGYAPAASAAADEPTSAHSSAVPSMSQPATAQAEAARGRPKQQREPCPRWYVSQSEFTSVPSYMKGRLTQDKVNAALEEAVAFSEANAKLMAAVRAPPGKCRLPEADRKRGVELYHLLADKENAKGRYWFQDADLAQGVLLRPDKTGKSVLTILRHLGRLQEVRVSSDKLKTVVYVLQQQP